MLQTARNFQKEQENENWKSWIPRRGDVYLVDLGQDENLDSEQRGLRPALIISNDIGNAVGSIVSICSITSKCKGLPKIHVKIGVEEGLRYESFILTEHIRSISKRRLFIHNNYPTKICTLSEKTMLKVEKAILFEFGFSLKNVN